MSNNQISIPKEIQDMIDQIDWSLYPEMKKETEDKIIHIFSLDDAIDIIVYLEVFFENLRLYGLI